jgi:hypothetical protein
VADLGDAGEVLWYFGSFWSFVLSRRMRESTLSAWRSRSLAGKLLGLLEGSFATLIGLGPIVLLVWLAREASLAAA